MPRTIAAVLAQVCFLLILFSSPGFGATIRVPSDQPTIQAGIDASVDGDTVLVADGTYSGPGNIGIDFEGRAISLLSENGPAATIIDCRCDHRGFEFTSGEKLSSILEGFSILGGTSWEGGGIQCEGSSPTIRNCMISGIGGAKGSGIYCARSSPRITDCTISGYTERSLSGIYCRQSSPIITNCDIYDIIAGGGGGGIYCYESNPEIIDCSIFRNTASYGGGIYCSKSSPTIRHCVIAGNETTHSKYGGGAIYCLNSTPVVANCTLTGNCANVKTGGIHTEDSYPVITNSILWDNDPPEFYVSGEGGPVVTYSDVQGGWTGEGNIDADPLFVDPDSWNFRLQAESPCIDAGDPCSRMDADGSRNDAGAFGGNGDMPDGSVGGCLSGTLSKLNSPYIVSENIVIETGAELEIEPGVELLIHNNSSIIVYGELSADGTPDDSITVTRYKEWDTCGGFRFLGGAGSLSFCRIENCRNGEGGAIYCASSSPRITGCTISGNSTVWGDGGGICCYDSFPTITNCLITGNVVTGQYDDGGGIYSCDSYPTISNCTISGNSASDGSGIYADYANITNCIIWLDSIATTRTGELDITFSDIEGGWPGEGNIDADPLFVDPESGDYRLQPGSPCIDAGDPHSRLDSDGSANDMGCFGGLGELPEGTIGGCVSGILSTDGSPYIVLSDLVIEKGTTLAVEPGVEIHLHNGCGVFVHGELLAEGTEDSSIFFTKFLDEDAGGGIRFVNGSGTLEYCTIQNCRNYNGGGIYCHSSHPSISKCTISGNTALGGGGGIYVNSSSQAIEDCFISDNYAFNGGGFFCSHSDISISGSNVTANRAENRGGGLYFYRSTPSITGCSISANSVDSSGGGGIYSSFSDPTIEDCTISSNRAEGTGGVFCYPSPLTILNSTISGNSGGSGIYCYESSIIENCVVSNNQCHSMSAFGGGIHCKGTVVRNCEIRSNHIGYYYGYGSSGGGIYCLSSTIENCIISGNSATGAVESVDGGGIYANSSSTISNCTITSNSVQSYDDMGYGGGIYCSRHGCTVIENCTLLDNRTEDYGGGVYCEGSSIIKDCIVTSNTGYCGGGGIYCEDADSLTISDCTVSEHDGLIGGGIFLKGPSNPIIENCIILDNVAYYDGGGIFSSDGSDAVITACTFSGNSAEQGGGIACKASAPTISSCLFIMNTAQSTLGSAFGGGVYCSGSPILESCTFQKNQAGDFGGGIYTTGNPTITNCILRDDSPDEIHAPSGDPVVLYSDIEGGWPGPGNIDGDPRFVKDEWGDYHLLWGSPCIDAGHPGLLDPDGTRSDMGAYSFDQSKELIIYLSPETNEINPGETGSVSMTICNSNPYETNFDAGAGIRLPDGSPWPGNPIVGPVYASIRPSGNLSYEFDFQVPQGWLPGTYSFAAGVGYCGRRYDLDHFEFDVVEHRSGIE